MDSEGSGSGSPNSWILVDQSDIWFPKCSEGVGGLFSQFYHFFDAFLYMTQLDDAQIIVTHYEAKKSDNPRAVYG